MLKSKGKLESAQKRALGKSSTAEIEAKKNKFREFLKVAGTGVGTQKESQSWNDHFEAFMVQPEENKNSTKEDNNEEEQQNKNEEE